MTLHGLNPHCMKLSGLKISWFYFLSIPSFLSSEYSRRIGRSSVLQMCFLSCCKILLRTYISPTLPLLLLQIETSLLIPYIYTLKKLVTENIYFLYAFYGQREIISVNCLITTNLTISGQYHFIDSMRQYFSHVQGLCLKKNQILSHDTGHIRQESRTQEIKVQNGHSSKVLKLW